MRICIDSCVFIRGIPNTSSDAGLLLNLISPSLQVVIPRVVAIETTHNLRVVADVAHFYRLFHERPFARIIDEPVPAEIFQRYVDLGLRAKGDAVIGAFAEWMRVDCLISDNRHFLRDLRTDAYRLLSPGDFLALIREKPEP